MALNHIIPAAISYQSELVDSAMSMKDLLGPKAQCKTQVDLVKRIAASMDRLSENAEKMRQERKKANNMGNSKKTALAYCDHVKPLMDLVREDVDTLEQLVDDELWPLPKLREILFTR
jgi:glutamine synthetase